MSVTSISASAAVQNAIASASQRTGVNFDYLLGQAKLESGLNANARAGTSSASGLYQFIEQSWLGVVKQHGAEYGLSWAADSIGRAGGRYTVSDPATRQAVLALRNDPQIASLMAAEHASDNKDALEGTLGRTATGTDLYMAHFLGLGGAKNFLSALQSNPGQSGAAMFPAAARANRSVFFDSSGQPRSLSDIYQRFAAKLGDAAASAGSTGAASDTSAQQLMAQALAMGDATVVTGNGQSSTDALGWAQSTLARFGGSQSVAAANLLRPTPDTARMAYMMLASMGA